MPKPGDEDEPVVILFLTETRGLIEIQVHAPAGSQATGAAFLERIQPAINYLDRLARGSTRGDPQIREPK